jgi:hypothetical protein
MVTKVKTISQLYDDELAPITSELGFLKCDVEKAASKFYEWQKIIRRPWGQELKMENVCADSLKDTLMNLLPLTCRMHTKFLFVPTKGKWTAYFDNGFQGSDPSSIVAYLAESIGCFGVRAVWIPNTIDGCKGRYRAVIFELYDKPNPILNIKRHISVINEGNWSTKWDFETSGDPLPFEDLEFYEAKRKTDKFTPELLDAYLKKIGIDAFSEDFYRATKEQPAKLFSITGKISKDVKKYSLKKARKNY